MSRSFMIRIDAVVSLVLGVALAAFPKPLVEWLGVPSAETTFYPRILGAIVIGIAIGLLIEGIRRPNGVVGVGLGGAIAIDLCAAAFLAAWLLLGGAELPMRGQIVLWVIVLVLVSISGLGSLAWRKPSTG